MHHLNYHTLAALAHALAAELTGGRLIQAFTQQRDELVLLLKGAQPGARALFLRLSCAPALPYAVPLRDFRRARANSADLFLPAHERRLDKIELVPGERLLCFALAPTDAQPGHTLVAKLHGAHANVLLLEAGTVLEIFRTGLEADWVFALPAPRPAPSAVAFEEAFVANGAPAALRAHFPAFDKLFLKELNLAEPPATLFAQAQALAQAAEAPPWHLELRPDGARLWAILPPAGAAHVVAYEHVGEALDAWLRQAHRLRAYGAERAALASLLEGHERRLRHRLATARATLAAQGAARSAEELANLLLAQLHAVPEGAEVAELDDYYRGGRLRLPLDPTLTPQANAERLYKAHREGARKLEAATRAEQEAEAALARLSPAREALEGVNSVRALRIWRATHATLLAEAEAAAPGARADAASALPFRQFEYQGWRIWVGKNAQSNMRLTFGHAHKDDLWLHARDAAGSHVVLRRRPGQEFPEAVIDYAAGLAAWFSKARTASLVAVTATPRKHVRTNRRFAPGQVAIDRGQARLVEPLRPPSADDAPAEG